MTITPPPQEFQMEWPSIFFADDPIGEIQQEQCLHKLCADGLMAWGNVMMKQRIPESFGVVLAAIAGRLGCSATPEGLMAWSDVNPIRNDAA